MRSFSWVLFFAGCGETASDPAATDVLADADGDGVLEDVDCDDLDADSYPEADELCDGEDNDCDGVVDNDAEALYTFYADGDGDGYGDPTNPQLGCTLPSGYVTDATDCDDADDHVNPGEPEVCDGADTDCDQGVDNDATDAGSWYLDHDADGFGDAGVVWVACTQPVGFVGDDTDCDDLDATIHPVTIEFCNGLDDNCDGTVDDDLGGLYIWYADTDGDGFGDPDVTSDTGCIPPTGYVDNAEDCDDSDAAILPGGLEVCDALDNDCDAVVDEADALGTSL